MRIISISLICPLKAARAFKPVSIRAGLCYQIFNLVPEINVLQDHFKNRDETYVVFGLRQLWLDNSANISLQYQSNFFSLGVAFLFKQLHLQYQFTYPMNELQEISIGTNQFTLCYNFDKYWGYPTSPEIDLISPEKCKVDTNFYHLQAFGTG